jgi:adenylate cyclase
MGNLIVGSPLALALIYGSTAELSLGMPGGRKHLEEALATARPVDPTAYAGAALSKSMWIALGASLPDDTALLQAADALALAERFGDPLTLGNALVARGLTLIHREGPDSEAGYELLAKVRAMSLEHHLSLVWVPIVDIHTALRKAQRADIDGAIELARAALDNLIASGDMLYRGWATTTLVESLLLRGAEGDIAEAQAVIDTLAAVPTDPGFVIHELLLLRMRALLAQAQSDDDGYRAYRDRYRKMANDLGFEGHMKWAEEMP